MRWTIPVSFSRGHEVVLWCSLRYVSLRNEAEQLRCEETRAIVSKIDWDCELHTRFLDENQGCGREPERDVGMG